MTPRTPLHTRPETITRYADISRELLQALTADVDAMAQSNDDERSHDAIGYLEHRGECLAERMERESWTEHTTQLLRDAMYLLAVGDNGATAAAEADPDGSSKQAHDHRRRAARERLEEQGLLTEGS